VRRRGGRRGITSAKLKEIKDRQAAPGPVLDPAETLKKAKKKAKKRDRSKTQNSPGGEIGEAKRVEVIKTGVPEERGRAQVRVVEMGAERLGDGAKCVLLPGEALYGLMSWLSSRPETIQLGANHDIAELALRVDEFCIANKIHRPKDLNWPKKVVIPGQKEHDELVPPTPVQPERPIEDPGARQARLEHQRRELRARRGMGAAPDREGREPPAYSAGDAPSHGFEQPDMGGTTSSERVADLAAGRNSASVPSGWVDPGPAVPFET